VDEGGSWRSFSAARHARSLLLPDICKDMIEQNYPTWISSDRNHRNNMTVTDAHGTGGMRYVVLYAVKPSKDSELDVDLVVKSAFEKDVGNLQRMKKTGVRQVIKTCFFRLVDVP
jgi:hypothetical protein